MGGSTDNVFPVDFICNVQYFQYSVIIYIEVLSHDVFSSLWNECSKMITFVLVIWGSSFCTQILGTLKYVVLGHSYIASF